MNFLLDVPVLYGSLVRLEPLSVSHGEDLAVAAEEDRGAYGFTRVPHAWEIEEYLIAHFEQTKSGKLVPFAQLRQGDGRAVGARRTGIPGFGRAARNCMPLRLVGPGWPLRLSERASTLRQSFNSWNMRSRPWAWSGSRFGVPAGGGHHRCRALPEIGVARAAVGGVHRSRAGQRTGLARPARIAGQGFRHHRCRGIGLPGVSTRVQAVDLRLCSPVRIRRCVGPRAAVVALSTLPGPDAADDVVWGLGMLGEATVRVVLAFLIAPATLLAISPLLAAAFLGPLAAWTLHRRRAAISAPEDSPRYRSAGDAAAQRDLPDGPRGDERDQGDRRAPQENLVDAAGDRGLVRLAQRCG